MSIVIHIVDRCAGRVASGSLKPVQKMVANAVTLIAPDLKPYLPDKPKDNQQHGGGGGGTRSPLDASKGKLPKIAPTPVHSSARGSSTEPQASDGRRPSSPTRRFRTSTRSITAIR